MTHAFFTKWNAIKIVTAITTIISFIIFMYVHQTSQHITPNNRNFLIIGHRGACGYKPENTLPSFQRALDLNVDMIELDVFVCATGELVVTHDDTVSVTTDGNGNVIDMSFDALRKLKVKGSGQIPTLQEVIDLVNRAVPINIELKGPNTAQPVAELIKTYLAQGWSTQDFIVSSFDHAQILELKKLCPNITVGLLFWHTIPSDIARYCAPYQASFVGFDVKAVTAQLVQKAHDAGYSMYVWTVNDKPTADHMRAFKVDGIFTNYPDRVRHSL